VAWADDPDTVFMAATSSKATRRIAILPVDALFDDQRLKAQFVSVVGFHCLPRTGPESNRSEIGARDRRRTFTEGAIPPPATGPRSRFIALLASRTTEVARVSFAAFCGNLSDRAQLSTRRYLGLFDRLLCVHFKLRKSASAKAG
jgi:hypothetical protein